jgi:hypothetical protein
MELNEKVQDYIKDSRFAPLNESEAAVMSTLLSNTGLAAAGQLPGLTEASLSGDVAQFTPILMPVVRRAYPALIANHILGVQPMTMPTGYVYALVNRYTGDSATKSISPVNKGQIIVLDTEEVVDGQVITGGTSGAKGTVIHVDDANPDNSNKGTTALIQIDQPTGKLFVTGEDVGGTAKIVKVYSNEANFMKILKTYTGPKSTAVGEQLAKDMATVGFGIERQSVEAKTRKLKAEYTLEMYDDLKAQHGMLVDEELTALISAELQNELDREIVGFVNDTATVVADALAPGKAPGNTFGRWELEKFRANAVKIDVEARNIGIETKRGSGNVLLVSPKVATMLQQVGDFKLANGSSTINHNLFTGNVGTFDGRYTVVVDQYSESDYITVLYKGGSRQDAIGFFCPYIPLQFQRVIQPDSGQPAILSRIRYGLVKNPLAPETYARTFGVDFTGTVLA